MSYYRQGPFRPGGPGVRFGVPGVTPYVKIIMITCGAIWLVQLVLFLLPARIDLSWLFGVVPSSVVTKLWVWQPVTYMFLHSPGEFFHILFNMLLLWMFGGELERHWGSRAFLRYYLVCGIGAGLASIPYAYFASGYVDTATIGASGAIFGLIVAYGMIFAERTVLFMMLFPVKARTLAIVMFALAFFYTITQPRGLVSHIAHLAGGLIGFLYLKRAWRIGSIYRDLKWRLNRRRFKVMPSQDRDDSDRWVN